MHRPNQALGELVDERGLKLPIGSQEDVGEFMLKFLERLDEGLRAGTFNDSMELPGPTVSPAVTDAPAEAAPNGGACSNAEVQEPALSIAGNASVGEGPVAVPNSSKPSLLQSLFFGEQVQVFSYRDNPGVVAPSGVTDCARMTEGQPAASQAPLTSLPPADPPLADAHSASQPGVSLAAAAPGSLVPPTEQGKLVVSEETGDFLQIFLDVKHKDLYSAWEAANCTTVEYTTPSGFSTEASTSMWIERRPKLLSFQLQRVVFDPDKKVQVKLDEPFTFDLTLHVDRFLRVNSTAAQATAARVQELRERRLELEKARSRFQEYQGRPGIGVADVLAMASQCLEENASASTDTTAATSTDLQLKLCDPHRIAAAGVPEAIDLVSDVQRGVHSAVQLLRGLQASCLAQENMLIQEINRLNTEAADAYQDLRQFPYDLHAIWVHQGIAGSGHYWAYVRDWSNSRWIRYDDSVVSVVTWDDVWRAAVGEDGSNTSAYVLVYLDQELAVRQSQPSDRAAALKAAEAALPKELLVEIQVDNGRLEEERAQQDAMMAEQELRQHAEAIFQHYAGLIHKWEPQKKTQDKCGNPHDPAMRKQLQDSALLSFELFLYRLHGEQEVWTHLIAQSIEAQRIARQWPADNEGRIFFHLANTLRSQKCYASMLREVVPNTRIQKCEFMALDMPRFVTQYNMILLQAHIVDEALQALKDDRGHLIKTIGMLAFVWGHWNLEVEDKYRQNEVLLIMSTLIYNTVMFLFKCRDMSLGEPAFPTATFEPVCEYFMFLLLAVEWPNSWKSPLINRIHNLFPHFSAAGRKDTEESARFASFRMLSAEGRKEFLLKHPMTQSLDRLESLELNRAKPGQEFFNRHRTLYSWLMTNDEAISREYINSIIPGLPAESAQIIYGREGQHSA